MLLISYVLYLKLLLVSNKLFYPFGRRQWVNAFLGDSIEEPVVEFNGSHNSFSPLQVIILPYDYHLFHAQLYPSLSQI